jgi:hypothetical protein
VELLDKTLQMHISLVLEHNLQVVLLLAADQVDKQALHYKGVIVPAVEVAVAGVTGEVAVVALSQAKATVAVAEVAEVDTITHL